VRNEHGDILTMETEEDVYMTSIKGTQTEKNLLAAFAGESQARNRYTYFAKQAKKEGYEQIAAAFDETANHESQHAKLFFRYLEGGVVEITASYPAGEIQDTLANLKASAAGENEEHTEIYPHMAEVARQEGFPQVAATFMMVSVAEKYHESRFAAFVKNMEEGTVFKKAAPTRWKCRNCGYIHEGEAAPDTCAACKHPTAHFELLGENY